MPFFTRASSRDNTGQCWSELLQIVDRPTERNVDKLQNAWEGYQDKRKDYRYGVVSKRSLLAGSLRVMLTTSTHPLDGRIPDPTEVRPLGTSSACMAIRRKPSGGEPWSPRSLLARDRGVRRFIARVYSQNVRWLQGYVLADQNVCRLGLALYGSMAPNARGIIAPDERVPLDLVRLQVGFRAVYVDDSWKRFGVQVASPDRRL